jgi:serine/threonine protein kinase
LPSTWQSQFEIVKEMPVIGAGAFGTIFHVRDRMNQRAFAVKVMQRQHYEVRGMGKQLAAEIRTMQRVSKSCTDPGWSRVVQLHSYVEEAGFVFLMLELCVYGNLAQRLAKAVGGRLSEATAARCSRHLFQGLRDIHAAGVIHRDIKAENLLITTNGVLKITDFGWATETSDSPRGLAGTFETMAPEVLKNQKHTSAVDLWSAGVVIFQMVTGRKLLRTNVGKGATQLSHQDPEGAERIRREKLLKEIQGCCPPSERMCPSYVSEACWDLIGQLLEPNAKERLTAEEALLHPWLQSDRVSERGRFGGA